MEPEDHLSLQLSFCLTHWVHLIHSTSSSFPLFSWPRHHCNITFLVWILPITEVSQDAISRLAFGASPAFHWGCSSVCTGATALCNIHNLALLLMVFHPTALASIKLVSWFSRPNQSIHHNTEINTDTLSLAPTEAVDFTDHVALTSWLSYIASFSLKKIRAFPTQNASQLLE